MAVVNRTISHWLVFWGTQTTIVRASDEDRAFAAFIDAIVPPPRVSYDGGKSFGRFVPPVREEVTIRRPRESDRGWIEDSGDKAFLALLPELVDA